VDPIVEQAQNSNNGRSILVQVHSSSTGDIFYNSRMGGRLNFYTGLNLFYGFPTLIVDGLKEPTWPYNNSRITSEINNRRAIETPINIESEISQTPGKIKNSMSIVNYKTTVTSETVIASNNLRLLTFVVEKGIDYSAPNGTQVHNHVALEIIPDENGIPVDFSDANNLSYTFEGFVDVTITDNLENHSIVAIVQDFGTGEVYQAIELTYDQFLDTEIEINDNPVNFNLNSVFPNQFNPSTNVSFSIGNESHVSIEVFNIIGERIDTLIDNIFYSPGNYSIQWNASGFPNGTYLFKMTSVDGTKIKKAILLK